MALPDPVISPTKKPETKLSPQIKATKLYVNLHETLHFIHNIKKMISTSHMRLNEFKNVPI